MDPELMELTREIWRRRGSTDPYLLRDLRQEMLLLQVYGRIPTVEDAKFSTEGMLNVDLDGKKVRVVHGPISPVIIWARWMDADIFVVARLEPEYELLGWISGDQVEESPIDWHERNGKRVDYNHKVNLHALSPIRQEGYPFSSHCSHSAGYWDYAYWAWRCFACDQIEYVAADVEMITRQDEEFFGSASSETPPVEEGPQREESKSRVRPEPELREQGGMF